MSNNMKFDHINKDSGGGGNLLAWLFVMGIITYMDRAVFQSGVLTVLSLTGAGAGIFYSVLHRN